MLTRTVKRTYTGDNGEEVTRKISGYVKVFKKASLHLYTNIRWLDEHTHKKRNPHISSLRKERIEGMFNKELDPLFYDVLTPVHAVCTNEGVIDFLFSQHSYDHPDYRRCAKDLEKEFLLMKGNVSATPELYSGKFSPKIMSELVREHGCDLMVRTLDPKWKMISWETPSS